MGILVNSLACQITCNYILRWGRIVGKVDFRSLVPMILEEAANRIIDFLRPPAC